jgi:flagellar basal-body rod protein FlgB
MIQSFGKEIIILSINDAPYFAMLKSRMSFLNDRQKVLADNVANASTPKFVPSDLDEKSFNQKIIQNYQHKNSFSTSSLDVAPVTMLATQSGHIAGPKTESTIARNMKAPDSEVTLDGNAVVLEEQMIKVADTRMNYDMAIGLYQKGLQLVRLSIKRPGG